jgi:hypothetical protein
MASDRADSNQEEAAQDIIVVLVDVRVGIMCDGFQIQVVECWITFYSLVHVSRVSHTCIINQNNLLCSLITCCTSQHVQKSFANVESEGNCGGGYSPRAHDGVHSEEECYIAPEFVEDDNHTENAFDRLHEEEAKIKL